jgi:hypothetical protein
MLAKGYSNKAIAINLDCCLTTAQKETRYVIRKYGASNRTMAALMIAGVLPAKGVMAELDNISEERQSPARYALKPAGFNVAV